MLKRLLFLLALGLVSLPAFAQDNQTNAAGAYVGYVSCPVRQSNVFLYGSLTSFDVLASPRCDDRVEVLGKVNTMGGYLIVRTADGKEGYLPVDVVTTTAPVKPHVAVPEVPTAVPAGQASPLAGPLSRGSSNFVYDIPRAEFFGGYSYLSADWENFTSRSAMHGWTGSGTVGIYPWLAAEGSVTGNYRNNCLGAPGLNCTLVTFMGGPKVTVYRGADVSVYSHALVGIGSMTMSLGGSPLTWRDLAWSVGGGADFAVNDHISVRLGQVDYLRTQSFQSLGGTHQNNMRISAGVVFRIGKLVTE